MSYSYKILVLDDDKLVTDSLKSLLAIEGFEDVALFNVPDEALDYLKQNRRDVIISDFMMPEMNGIEFLSRVKKMYPESSTILLTGYADKENAIKGINEAGLYKYIEKPWDNDELIINIKNAFERADLIRKIKEKNEELKQHSENLEKLVKEKISDLYYTKERLGAIISNCADGIVIVSKNSYVLDANPAAELFFGLSASILKTKKITELFEGKTFDISSIITSSKNEILREIEITNSVNGMKIPVEVSCSFIPSLTESEEPKYVLVIRDTSFQKEAERLREDFIATLTHDLRTPALAAIQTFEYFLNGKIGELSEKQLMFISNLKKSNEDMLGMINTLLEVYKYEAGRLNLVKTEFSFSNLLKECVERVKPLADAKKQTVIEKYECNTEPLNIIADRNELMRVVVNLLGNAVKYTGENGIIEIYAEIDNNDLRFSVKDNGEGIHKYDIPKLFKRFSRGTKEKRSISTGLGLYLSKQIVDAHGGKIWLESDKGKGSEFFVLLVDAAADKKADKSWKV